MRFTIIDEGRITQVMANASGEQVRLEPAELHRALGWELKPQGVCKDERCIPRTAAADLVTDDGVELTAFARLLERPLALDVDAGVAYLGASAATRAAQLASLDAPDFTLPDLSGQRHSLSAYRGKKVLLVAYASW